MSRATTVSSTEALLPGDNADNIRFVQRLEQWLRTSAVDNAWYSLDDVSRGNDGFTSTELATLERHSLASQLQVTFAMLHQALLAYGLHGPNIGCKMSSVMKRLNTAFADTSTSRAPHYQMTGLHMRRTYYGTGADRTQTAWWAFGATEPQHDPKAQIAAGSKTPQPKPLPRTRHGGGPVADVLDAEPGEVVHAATAAAASASHVTHSLESILSALERVGVSIDRSKLPAPSILSDFITLPQGGKVGSSQRARLVRAGCAAVEGIAAAVNSDGAGTAAMIGEALAPRAPLEERQLHTANAHVAANVVETYKDARARGATMREQRQILSALAPRSGRKGYTRKQLADAHDLKLTKYEWRAVRLHALTFGCAATADADVKKPQRMSPSRMKDAIGFIFRSENMQQVAYGMRNLELSDGGNLPVPAALRTKCRAALYHDYAEARKAADGCCWHGKKEEQGSYGSRWGRWR